MGLRSGATGAAVLSVTGLGEIFDGAVLWQTSRDLAQSSPHGCRLEFLA